MAGLRLALLGVAIGFFPYYALGVNKCPAALLKKFLSKTENYVEIGHGRLLNQYFPGSNIEFLGKGEDRSIYRVSKNGDVFLVKLFKSKKPFERSASFLIGLEDIGIASGDGFTEAGFKFPIIEELTGIHGFKYRNFTGTSLDKLWKENLSLTQQKQIQRQFFAHTAQLIEKLRDAKALRYIEIRFRNRELGSYSRLNSHQITQKMLEQQSSWPPEIVITFTDKGNPNSSHSLYLGLQNTFISEDRGMIIIDDL